MITLCGHLLVSRTDDDPPPCQPCVHSKRARVYVQNVPVCTGTTRTCVSTCARGAGTHGDVLSGHTGFHGATQHIPHHTTDRTHTTTQDTTQYNNTTTTPHGDRERQRQRETDREEKTAEERQEKRRQNKTRQEKTRQDKNAKRREKMKHKTREETRQEAEEE